MTVQEQPFDAQTPLGPIHMINLRATLPGTTDERGRLVIGGHYDTKLFRDFPFVGASDGGSSAAFLLELARALKGRRNALPIELLFLDGEEAIVDWTGTDHTYGSRHYVAEARRTGTVKDIRAFVLVDMIGDRELGIRREQNSTPWLTDAIWTTARRLKRPEFLEETDADRRRPPGVSRGRHSVGRHHRSRLPCLASRRGSPGPCCRRQSSGRGRRPRRRAAGHRSPSEVNGDLRPAPVKPVSRRSERIFRNEVNEAR